MMTVKDLTGSSLTANGLLLRNNEITKNLAPVPSLLSLPSQNNSSNHTGSPPTPPNSEFTNSRKPINEFTKNQNSLNHTGSPPTPPNTAKSANSRIHENNSRIHENSEAKKGSRFSFSVDSLLSTVAQTKKPPTPTYSMIFLLL